MSTDLKNLSDFSSLEIPSAHTFRFALLVSKWNDEITDALHRGALDTLYKYGALKNNIHTFQGPGSFELISGADLILSYKQVNVVICLGCVIQGETRHFDFICNAVANGLSNVSIKHNKPVIFGVLTTENLEQARERAGGKHGNKGEEAAVTAIKMAQLQHDLVI